MFVSVLQTPCFIIQDKNRLIGFKGERNVMISGVLAFWAEIFIGDGVENDGLAVAVAESGGEMADLVLLVGKEIDFPVKSLSMGIGDALGQDDVWKNVGKGG